jgi:hypothetical protein
LGPGILWLSIPSGDKALAGRHVTSDLGTIHKDVLVIFAFGTIVEPLVIGLKLFSAFIIGRFASVDSLNTDIFSLLDRISWFVRT